MATYIIGDVHGCWQTLEALLERCGFDEAADQAIFVGDLVNRGPSSLQVLRWAVERAEIVDTVLGNHDLHLLACAAELEKSRVMDTFKDVLEAADRDRLLGWLRTRPFMIEKQKHTIVHAGLHPSWTLEGARKHARALKEELSAGGNRLLEKRRSPDLWNDASDAEERQIYRLAVFTRMRAVAADGALIHGFSGGLGDLPSGSFPWFRAPDTQWSNQPVIFGHWAALGQFKDRVACCLDGGCVWGGSLLAKRLEDGKIWSEKSRDGNLRNG